ncbi:MAG: hypothetical protein H0X17_12620 [Deltaproteobacteria bacterium]|nr:hypothetical protein [Deltaproteobacteria bacterium]
MLRVLIPVILLAAASGGCRRDPDAAPPCGAIGAKLLVIARADLDAAGATHDDATRRGVLDQLPAMRDALVNACKETRWTDAVRRCLVAAPDHVAFEGCQQQLTDSQRQALDRPSPKPSS